jgi:hypothetical protein
MLALRVVDLVRYRQAIRMLALRVVDLVRYRQAIRIKKKTFSYIMTRTSYFLIR